jgi:uncharacterized protein (TIGR02231 family)
MRFRTSLLVLALGPGVAHAAEVPALSRVDSVLVFPSGAEVRRVATLKLEGGEHTVILSDLPQQAIPASIRVEGKGTGRLEIGSVDSRRVVVSLGDPATVRSERRRIEDEIERFKDQRSGFQAQIATADAQKAFVNQLTQLPGRPAPVPAPGQGSPREDWSQILGLIGTSMAELQRVQLEAEIKIRDIERKIAELEKRLAGQAPPTQERTEVKVFVSAQAQLDAELVVRYQVANASWVPLYDARLSTGAKNVAPKLALTRRAQISQRTGEAWDDVALALSTARPAGGTTAPELRPLLVDFEAEGPQPPPRPVGGIAPAARVRSFSGAQQEASASDKAAAAEPQMRQADEAQTVADVTAFQAVFSVPGKVTIPNTGDPKRVRIGEDEAEPMLTVRMVPSREEKGFLYAKVVLPRGAPYPAGQVALFRDQTFVGNGRMPMRAPGEEHELGFGPDDSVRVKRTVLEEKRGETGLISSSRTENRNFRISIKNLHERPISFVAIDQLPVSLNQDIKVELTGKTVPTKRDAEDKRGLLAWEDKIAPDEERVIEFGYRITWPGTKNITVRQ